MADGDVLVSSSLWRSADAAPPGAFEYNGVTGVDIGERHEGECKPGGDGSGEWNAACNRGEKPACEGVPGVTARRL